VRGFAVSTLTRSPALPDVPTVAELGYKNFEASGWLGILVPNGVSPAVIARLNSEMAKVMQSPELKKALIAQGVEARTSSPAEFGSMINSEKEKWH
jgi:tripartite-type tricarboxylate transporter receptor subunit TctC